ncbi:MAG: hypothetical protein M5U28_10580 [Sandaracinaceae bacterium]|nr:hypothetical protein [Sandaracinaceae bacterium]
MARLTVGQKGQRSLQFMVGIRNRRVRRALAAHGFREEDFEEGFARLKDIAKSRLDLEPVELDPRLVRELDEWENRWFPIVDATLRHNFPDIHARVFLNLRQTEGVEVVLSVSTLLDRLDEVVAPVREGGMSDGRAALALLQRRGLTEEVVAAARALLAEIGSLEADEDGVDEELEAKEREEAERRLWSWYLEWSAIARAAIRDRRLLRMLGFLRTTRRADGTVVEEEVEEEEPEEDVEVEPPAPADPVPA